MELRGQDDKDIGIMPSSMGYTPPQPNQESPSKLSSVPIISTPADRRRNGTGRGSTILSPTQALDHHHLHRHQHQHHQLNLQQPPPPPPLPLPPADRPARDQNPDPDPALPASATIAGASNSKTPPPQSQPTSTPSIRYRDCLKNHAASMGGNVVDGCGEFMPSGEEGTTEALKCAACDCHRNFHRKEIDGESQSGAANCYYTYNPNRNSSQRTTIHPTQPPVLPHPQHHKYSHAYSSHALTTSPTTGPILPMMMAFGGSGGAAAESSSEDLNMFQSNAGAQPMVQPSFSLSKKRFRTKFTQEQKHRMHDFAEKLGWKIQKQDEQEVQQLEGFVEIAFLSGSSN